MSRKLRLPIVIGSAVLLLILFYVFGSFALAQGDSSVSAVVGEGQVDPVPLASPVPGGPGFVSLSPAAFTPVSEDYRFSFYGLALYNSGPGWGEYYAAIPLPNRATITKFVIYFYDLNGNGMVASLVRGPFDSFNGDHMAYIQTAGAADFIRSAEITAINHPVIDQQSYSYLVWIYIPPTSDVRLVSARVDYSYPTNLPLITK